jgi:hypothetical protein
MHKAMTALAVVLACAAGGCATKRYPIATNLGQAEASSMTCRELDLELIRAEEVRKQISDTAKVDWRSVAGFLGDYGIGNAMAKNDAEKAINNRVTALNAARVQKNCTSTGATGMARLDALLFGD